MADTAVLIFGGDYINGVSPGDCATNFVDNLAEAMQSALDDYEANTDSHEPLRNNDAYDQVGKDRKRGEK